MISDLHIKNFKSVVDVTVKLGRVTMFIGENGGGKSNILEALALASAAASYKLDNEFLISRGIRLTEPQFMRSAFGKADKSSEIEIQVSGSDTRVRALLNVEGTPPYTRWRNRGGVNLDQLDPGELARLFPQGEEAIEPEARRRIEADLLAKMAGWSKEHLDNLALPDFLIYSPEITALRTFEREGQILPLGIRGEGLFKLLKVLGGAPHRERLEEIKENLAVIDWYKDFRIPSNLAGYEQSLEIEDRYLDPALACFDQRSANEGFLFLLFYFALFVSPDTPSFFAIDNIDASLNPKLCSELIRRLVILSEKYEKQVVITTHNPAVLDGINLNDDQQRLFVVHRNSKGGTRARRISAPQPIAGEPPVKLSEAFLRGILGGLPQNF